MPTTLPNSKVTGGDSDALSRTVTNARTGGGGTQPPIKPRRSGWKIFGTLILLIVVLGVGLAAGMVLKALQPGKGEVHGGRKSITDRVSDIWNVVTDPKSGFPGQSKITICCMGIDDNWTNSDEVYTAGSRTDTLFLLTLDLDTKKITMLSIPRDANVPVAGTNYSGKINAAYATGGPARTESTIAQWLNVRPDYYMVLNIDATKRLVDALGGVDVNVEHQMDYDDAWGHLHVHLKPGEQHLDGSQAVGFARFRHANHGVTPEDGDERRMYRQHILMQAMMVKAKSLSSIVDANTLIDTGMSCIRTDLTRVQLADLGAIFHSVNPASDVETASLVGQDARGAHGEYVMAIDPKQAQLYVDWLVNGNENAGRELTPVTVANGTSVAGMAARATSALRGDGFEDCTLSASSSSAGSRSATQIVDTGVANRTAAADIAALLGISDAVITRIPVEANRYGWAPPASVHITLGTDYVRTSPSTSAAQ